MPALLLWPEQPRRQRGGSADHWGGTASRPWVSAKGERYNLQPRGRRPGPGLGLGQSLVVAAAGASAVS